MYTPPSFAVDDRETLFDCIERNSFATLITSNGGVMVSHLPLLLDRELGEQGRLVGHMARANPQWEQADAGEAIAIFHGPHAYISPAWYEAENVVPTWNYVAVHAHGTFQLDNSPERRLEIVRRTVETYEAHRTPPWSLDSVDADFTFKLLDAIVAFEIPIDRIEGKWKLNQNHDEQRRGKVIRALRDIGGDDEVEMAGLMEETVL